MSTVTANISTFYNEKQQSCMGSNIKANYRYKKAQKKTTLLNTGYYRSGCTARYQLAISFSTYEARIHLESSDVVTAVTVNKQQSNSTNSTNARMMKPKLA